MGQRNVCIHLSRKQEWSPGWRWSLTELWLNPNTGEAEGGFCLQLHFYFITLDARCSLCDNNLSSTTAALQPGYVERSGILDQCLGSVRLQFYFIFVK